MAGSSCVAPVWLGVEEVVIARLEAVVGDIEAELIGITFVFVFSRL